MGLSLAEADTLALLGEQRPGFCERGHRSVRLSQYCGVVSLGERALEIIPKIGDSRSVEAGRSLLLQLLHDAEDFPVFRDVAVGQHLREGSLLEVFIAAFFDSISAIIQRGLLRQYQEQEADLQVVRGRILSERQFVANANRPDRLACRFDELTPDNAWNRLLKAGLHAVRSWITSARLQRRWIELMGLFEEVSSVSGDSQLLSRLVFDRHSSRYRIAIEWVRWILDVVSPNLRFDKNAAPGLLFDMNLLFESAVAGVVRRRAGSEVRVVAQDTGRHLASVPGVKRSFFGLRPDLVVRRGGVTVAIGDTKWKTLEVGSTGHLVPAVDDMYQMHAYAAAFQCEHLALIYPWHEGLTQSLETAFQLPMINALRPVVTVVCLDLHQGQYAAKRGAGSVEFGALFQPHRRAS